MELQTKLRFLSLYRMVLADGIISPDEMVKLRSIGLERYNLSDDAIEKILLEDVAEIPNITSDIDKIRLLYEMAQIAWADGELDSSEKELLISYATHFGVDESSMEDIVKFLLDCAHDGMSEDDVVKNFN